MHDRDDLVVNDMTTRKEAEDAVYTLLTYLDSDPDREGLKDTPRRVIDSGTRSLVATKQMQKIS